ncbi:hypothetical protein ACFRAE_11380 [Sphingobacterium sp. HJSM2_6]|uniref:hypothetical protein n=1 Tax=Sphingobacterium sp. HJSM2_6 TaxID=3366264 RepID=UPI003BCFB75E
MKTKHLLLTMSLGLLLLNSCRKDNLSRTKEAVILEQDQAVLKQRISSANSGIVFLDNTLSSRDVKAGLRANTSTSSKAATPEISLSLVKEVLPPKVNDVLVRVTHVAIEGDFAYVSYNREGETYLGGIDVIDIKDINDPKLLAFAGIPNMDISAVAVSGSNLHFAGAAEVGTIEGVLTPAVVGILPLVSGRPTVSYQLQSLIGQVATDFTLDGNFEYVVSGSNGEISKLNKNTLEVVKRVSVSGLLSVRTNANHVVALSADKGLLIYDKDLNQLNNYQTEQNDVVSKRNIELYNNYALVSEGVSGLGIYELSSGNLFQRIPVPAANPESANIDASELTTISVSVFNKRVFIANGAAGISIYKFLDGNAGLAYVGSANLDVLNEGSSNFVLTRNNYVFVAGGKGGLKILKLEELTPVQPTCDASYPKYEGSVEWDLNVNKAASYADSKVFKNGVNISKDFNWCGSLQSNNLQVNGNVLFNMSGSLSVINALNVNSNMLLNGTGLVGGDININGNSELYVKGSLTQGASGKSTNVNVNNKLKIEGEVVIYGNLTINGSGNIELMNSNSKLTVYGNVMLNGSIKVNGKVDVHGNYHSNNGTIEFVNGNAKFNLKGTEGGKTKLVNGAVISKTI